MQAVSTDNTSTPRLFRQLLNYMTAMKDDFEASLELLSEDVVWINHLPEHVPFGGEYHGREGVVEYFQQLAVAFEIGDYPVGEFDIIETGDTLVMVGYEKDGKALPTGVVFDLHFVWVVKFDAQGRIRFLQEHNDTAAIGDAFRSQ